MQSEEKLREARYFLDKLRTMPEDTEHEREYMYLLSAFLNSWRSVMDVMLYDYAEKFSLGFTRQERITDRDFKVAARVLNHTQAKRFIQWWEQKRGKLMQNPLWTKRTMIVHRGYPETKKVYTLFIAESVALSSTFTTSGGTSFTVSAAPGAVEISFPSALSPAAISTTAPTESRVETRFSDLPDQSVLDYCQQAFHEMEQIVNYAKGQF